MALARYENILLTVTDFYFYFILMYFYKKIKTVRVAVFAEGPTAEEARAAGADVVGGDELIEEIRTGTLFSSIVV
jgi:hypothetical protein